MKTFTKIFSIIGFLLVSTNLTFGQAVTSEPTEYTDPTTEVKIIVNLGLLDQTLEHTQLLLQAANDGLDMYIWTWKPFEFPAGSPKANGEGAQAWKNSNELLKMTMESDLVYSYTMIPTEFYEVDAATVYGEDIFFLIKPKDGGGYGDPDIKSEDLTLEINPPNVARTVVYGFPSSPLQDDIFRIVYDNYREDKVSMQNLEADQCYVFLEVTLTDGSTITPSGFFQVGNNPDLQMKLIEPGIFEIIMIPEVYFNLQPGQKIDKVKAIVMKKNFLSGADRVDDDYIVDMACWND
ncbi:MAG: hypothetical protein WED33_07100 [Bacteroidia bacterium]